MYDINIPFRKCLGIKTVTDDPNNIHVISYLVPKYTLALASASKTFKKCFCMVNFIVHLIQHLRDELYVRVFLEPSVNVLES